MHFQRIYCKNSNISLFQFFHKPVNHLIFFIEEFAGTLKSILILNASIILQKIKRSEAFLARWVVKFFYACILLCVVHINFVI